MKANYWHSGALICPRKAGFDVVLTSKRWVHRDTEQKAKWAATAFRTLHGKTFKEEYAACT